MDTLTGPLEPEQTPAKFKQAVASPIGNEKRAVDGGGTVDVLVLHTLNALNVVGSQEALDALILGSFTNMQTALDNSQAFRVRINHALGNGLVSQFVGYDESPAVIDNIQRWYAHRRWVRTDPAAVAARNAFQADLVVLAVGDAAFCGVAYTQRPDCGQDSGEPGCGVGLGYDPFAVSVIGTSARCGLPTHTLAHEVGHQFGLEHDPPNGAVVTRASFPWSYGHTVSTTAVQARTIMAYEITTGQRTNCANGCPIQLHYSNPQVEFQAWPGTPTGVNGADAQGRSRVNARTSVLYAPAMETFRGPEVPDFGVYGHGFESLPDIVCDPVTWPNCPQ